MYQNTRKFLRNGWLGQGGVEYSLMLAFIGVVLISVTGILYVAIENQYTEITECINASSSSKLLTLTDTCEQTVAYGYGYTDPSTNSNNSAPTADIAHVCNQLACDFTGSNSSDSDGSIVTYSWNFGDGSAATGKIVSHSYAAGSYTVRLTVTDNDGAIDSTILSITVSAPNNAPSAVLTHSCTNTTCTFTDNGSFDNDGSIVNYSWDFGDGSTATSTNASHTYVDGTYTVTLTVTDDDGAIDSATQFVVIGSSTPNNPPTANMTYSCTGLTCSFGDNGSSDSDGSIVSYSWDFGDGSTATGTNVNHTYAAGSYTVTLTVTDNNGASQGNSQIITVSTSNVAPTAIMDFSCTGLTCNFTDNGSSDSDGTIVGYYWDFRDGSTATGATASHTFAAGTYAVILRVTDNDAALGTSSATVTVSESAPSNQAPVASISSNCSARSCQFNSTSTDSDGSVVSHTWDFGDSTTASGATVNHTYPIGTYTVTLTVMDNDGASNQTTTPITITNSLPTAGIYSDCSGSTCTFSSTSSDSDGTVISYSWDFGDSNTATGASVSHSFADGNYTVQLTVSDNDGGTASTTKAIKISTPKNIWIDDVDAIGADNGTKKWDLQSLSVHVSNASGSVQNITVTIDGASCTTDASGSCTVDIPDYTLNNNASQTVAITDAAGTNILYVPGSNSDDDSDNVTVSGNSVTVSNLR